MKDERIVIKGTTPEGEAIFPKLTEPDNKFNPDGEYSVKIRLSEQDGEAIYSQMKRLIEGEVKKAQEQCKTKLELSKIKVLGDESLPCKKELDENAEETGYYIFSAKMRASGISQKTGKAWSREPAIFDQKGKIIANKAGLNIWSGSIIRIAYSLIPFNTALGIGVSSKLEAVQIIELVSGSSGTAKSYGFDVVEELEEETPFKEEADIEGDY